MSKDMFVSTYDGNEQQLQPITDQLALNRGDNVLVRLTVKVDRDMDFVHIKDMRGAGLEPVNVLSGYRWGQGLSYYESTTDQANEFFIDRMRRGTYVIEYPLRVAHSGSFENGVATLQCHYAPEFSAHTSSRKLQVKH